MAEANQITWTDDLSVGHKKLDGQHQGLIRLINKFGIDALSPEQMAKQLDGLIAYAARHFNDEEDFIMRKASHLLDHQADQHAKFIEAAYDFSHRFHEGEGDALRKEVYGFLCQWLIKHIREEDQQYKPKPKA